MSQIRFIADIHLDVSQPDRIRSFADFLNDCQKNHAQLYILGDLFNFWVGDAQRHDPVMQSLLSVLQNFQPPQFLFFLPGNRDFLFAPLWKRMGGQIAPEGTKINVDQKTVLLYHGDTFCTKDYSYQWIRRILRCHFIYHAAKILPCWVCVKLGRWLRQKSTSHVKKKSEFVLRFDLDYLHDLMKQQQAQLLICGHAHQPHWLSLEDKQTLCILPECCGHTFRYLEWNEQTWELQEWHPAASLAPLQQECCD